MRVAGLIGAVAVALMTTSAFGQDVTYDYDRSADFSKLKTYGWTRGTPVNDELNDQRIVRSIEAQLAAKGLTKVEAGQTPDVLVAYHVALGRDLQVNGNGYRLSRWGSARVEQLVTGAPVVDLLEAGKGSVLWRGIATRDLDLKADAEKREKNIAKATEKLFKNYPPKE